MTTHRSIVQALFRAADQLEDVVLATVVRITGSSYGGVGTRMVARMDGSTVGIVSGGCLESDLAEHAMAVHASHMPRLVSYDTRADDETAWGLGLGCNGLIDVLLEPLTPVEAAGVGRLLEQALDADSTSVVATVIASTGKHGAPAVGAHALFIGGTIETVGDWGDRKALDAIDADLPQARATGRRGFASERDGIGVAFETVAPAIRLVICGGGPDVVPLVAVGSTLGWNVTVVDHRPDALDRADRFRGASVTACEEPHLLGQRTVLTPRTAVVVMSHNYPRDLAYLRSLLAGSVGYIGLLGPRARTERMLAELASGERESARAKVFAPIGLDVGGDGPEAIALAIASEVSSVINGRDGGHLRDRSTPLHG